MYRIPGFHFEDHFFRVPLDHDDRMVSVLPLHHTFEFTCGLLLPLARGCRVVYLDEITGDRLTTALKVGRATAMVGVPALWELLERRIQNRVAERGKVALPIDLIVAKELTVVGSYGMQVPRYASMLAMIETGKLNPRGLVSRTIALEETAEVLASMDDYATLGIPVIHRY